MLGELPAAPAPLFDSRTIGNMASTSISMSREQAALVAVDYAASYDPTRTIAGWGVNGVLRYRRDEEAQRASDGFDVRSLANSL